MPHRGRFRRASIAPIVVFFALGGCGSEPPSGHLPLDGNVIVGEGGIDDDSGRGDVGDARDGGLDDLGISSDAQPGDVPVADANSRDSSTRDGSSEDAATDPCDEAPSLGMTSEFALDPRAEAYWGRVVEILGTPTVGTSSCAESEPINGCREACVADVYVDGKVRLVPSMCILGKLGCFGNECSLTCTPPLLGLPQHFIGILDGTSDAQPVLQILRIEP